MSLSATQWWAIAVIVLVASVALMLAGFHLLGWLCGATTLIHVRNALAEET